MINKINVDIDLIKRNSASIRDRVDQACIASGRNTDDVKVICVSKYVFPETIGAMAANGITSFGENRVDDILEKEDYCKALGYNNLDWHLIGHLQTNKVKKLKDRDNIIHSCDTVSLLDKLNKLSATDGIKRQVMLEFNISGEESKSGFSPEDLNMLLDKCPQYQNLTFCGLMTMAPKDANDHLLGQVFGQAHKMYVDIGSKNIDNMPMMYLSMGMSSDFEIAIREGANLLRIGSTFFH